MGKWQSRRNWAYPRRHGGNRLLPRRSLPLRGLSPQARGKRFLDLIGSAGKGPIPAGTGETIEIDP